MADAKWEHIRKGWCFGAEGFREELTQHIEKAESRVRRDSLEGDALRSHDRQIAEKQLYAMLKALGLRVEDLPTMPKGAREKKLLAWGLRTFTTVSREWITQRLCMGHVSRVTQSVCEVSRQPEYQDDKDRLQEIVKLSD